MRKWIFAAAIAFGCATTAPKPETTKAALGGPFYCCPPSGLICRPGQRDYAGDLLSTQFQINAHCAAFSGHCHCP